MVSGVYNDLAGQRFTRLVVLHRIKDGKCNSRWLCRCDCGNTTTCISGNLLAGYHKSCGCYRAGPTAYNYKERTYVNGYAFIKRPNHKRAHPHTGRVREHIVVMEEKLNRELLPHEEVHHLNGVRDDNRPENLELWTKSQPAGGRIEDKVQWAVEILQQYAPSKLKMTL